MFRAGFQRLPLFLSFQASVLSEWPRLRPDYKEPAFSRTKSIMMLLGKNAKREVVGGGGWGVELEEERGVWQTTMCLCVSRSNWPVLKYQNDL